jgi:hypothetical protein
MKSYVIDELRYPDYEALKTYLDENLEPSGVDGLYWLELGEALLTDLQKAHTECRPLYFAIALSFDHLSCELLVRTRQILRCDCMTYATQAQRNWLVDWADEMFHKLGLCT